MVTGQNIKTIEKLPEETQYNSEKECPAAVLGEEVEVSLADAGMVVKEMEPLLCHLDCFRRNLIKNLEKPRNM
jgi:hypothetical protein